MRPVRTGRLARALALAAVIGAAFGCGRYGPPVRTTPSRAAPVARQPAAPSPAAAPGAEAEDDEGGDQP